MELIIRLGSEDQARAVERALDLYARLSMGQIEELEYLVRQREIRSAEGADKPGVADVVGLAERILPFCKAIKDALGHHPHGSFGIAHQRVSRDAHRCWEIKKVLAKALAMHREPNPKFPTVDYDGLWRRFTDDPEPRVEIADPTKGLAK
jgi:hypothetical protein